MRRLPSCVISYAYKCWMYYHIQHRANSPGLTEDGERWAYQVFSWMRIDSRYIIINCSILKFSLSCLFCISNFLFADCVYWILTNFTIFTNLQYFSHALISWIVFSSASRFFDNLELEKKKYFEWSFFVILHPFQFLKNSVHTSLSLRMLNSVSLWHLASVRVNVHVFGNIRRFC